MASLDLEKLLQEVSPDSPCGNDLEYEPEFQELERSTQYRPEQQIGDAIVEAYEPNWRDVQRASVELFSKTKDLRVAVYLARAVLHNDGFVGFSAGLSLIKGLIENYWDDVHPKLDPDDNNDPTFRVNTISGLADADTVLKSVKMSPVVAARGIGQFSIRDIDIAKGLLQVTGDESPPDLAVIDAAFMETGLEELQATSDAVKECRERVADIEKIFTEKVSAAQSPNLTELNKILHHIGTELTDQLERRGVTGGEAGEQTEEAGGQAMVGKTAAPISGSINSREDVIRMLDKICDYYKNHEPSSPLPILLKRAKRLVRKDFIEIIQDIVPEAMKQVEFIRGKEE